VIVEGGQVLQLRSRDGRQIGLARQPPAQPADGVLDAALLPRCVGIAEEGLDAQGLAQGVVLGELGAVVEGDGLAKRCGQRREQVLDAARHPLGVFGRLARNPEQARSTLVHRQDRLAVLGELHRVGFPVARVGAVAGRGWALGDRHPIQDVQHGAAPLAAAVAPFALAAGQIAPPGVVLGARDLGVEEAVDGLVADDRATLLERQATGHFLRGQTHRQQPQHQGL
jgi:hypothetical protein